MSDDTASGGSVPVAGTDDRGAVGGPATVAGADQAHGEPGAPATAPGTTTPGAHPRPTSRRARAALRRRGQRSTDRPRPAAAVPPEPPEDERRGRPVARRRGRRLRRRRRRVILGLGACTAAGLVLAVTGLTLVRTSTAGRYIEPSARPDEPGYQAHVVPTPTLAVVHRGPEGELAGLALLALRPGDDGGSILLVPPSTVVPFGETELTLDTAYWGGGPEATVASLERVLNADITESVDLDDERWAELVAPVAPLQLHLDAPVGRWEAGEVSLTADEVGEFLAARDDDETDLDRLDRAERFWTAWVDAVAGGGADAVPGEVEVGIGRFVRGLADGEAAPVALPVTAERREEQLIYRPDEQRVPEIVADVLPFPVSPRPGARPRIRLLNGTTDEGLTAMAARRLVRSGAEIAIVGNGPSFREATTRLIHRTPDRGDEARRMAAALGVGAVEEVPLDRGGIRALDDEIDVTVILGSDAGDLREG